MTTEQRSVIEQQVNSLTLSGVLRRYLGTKKSPAGLSHCYFVLEHSSAQQEAALARRIYCRIRAVAVGEQWPAVFAQLAIGANISVQGFIATQRNHQGELEQVFHAQDIRVLSV